MIDIIESREMTDKEKKRYELEQEILRKQQELNELDNDNAVDEKETKVDTGIEMQIETAKKDNRTAEEVAQDIVKDNLWTLSEDEEKVVSDAIKYDADKEQLNQKQLNSILEKSRKEYESIKPDTKFPVKNIVIMIVIAFILVMASRLATGNTALKNLKTQTNKESDNVIIKDVTDEINGEIDEAE